MDDTLIAQERFDPNLRKTFAALLDTMIPVNEAICAPSAGSEEIVNDVIASISSDASKHLVELLKELNGSTPGMTFEQSDFDARWEAFTNIERDKPHIVRLLGGILLQCYYRNDQVLESLGLEARSPFPSGHEVEQGDWSLLDPVKARGKIYRAV